MSARDGILATLRRRLDGAPGRDAEAVARRIEDHAANLVPERAQVGDSAALALFVKMAEEASATVERVASEDAVPEAVAGYLAARNLPARARRAPGLDGLPWDKAPLLELASGAAEDADPASITPALAAVAETGTLVLASGAGHPATLNSLPETHIVVLRRDQIVGSYEEAWARLRAAGAMPRTVAMVTGPSRSGDIEQTILLGAHGPKRLHIVLVDSDGDDAQG